MRHIGRFSLCNDGGTGEVHRVSLAVAIESANGNFLSIACTLPFRLGLIIFFKLLLCRFCGLLFAYCRRVFLLRTSQDQLGEEGLHSLKFAKSSEEDGELSQQSSKQRSRARLHLAVSSLKGQSTEDSVSVQNVSSVRLVRP